MKRKEERVSQESMIAGDNFYTSRSSIKSSEAALEEIDIASIYLYIHLLILNIIHQEKKR